MVMNSYGQQPVADTKALNTEEVTKLSSKILIGRVTKVFLENTNDENLGAIEVETVNTANANTYIAYPFFSNMNHYPLVDEIVTIFSQLPSEAIGTELNNTRKYYLGVVNVWNNNHVNFYPNPLYGNIPLSEKKTYEEVIGGSSKKSDPNFSKSTKPGVQEYFKERDNIHPLQPYLGDIIYQGRWGNSIRFGSTNNIVSPSTNPANTLTTSFNTWSSNGESGDPITILRNGQPLDENNLPKNPWTPITESVNNDPSSIYLTSTQLIQLDSRNFRFFSYKPKDTPKSIKSYPIDVNGSQSQIILNSDRLVLNAKKDHVLIGGEKSVNLSSNNSLNFDTKNYIVDAGNIKLGGQGAKEPLVKGDSLVKKLNTMLTVLIQFFDIAQTQQMWPGGVPTTDGATSMGASSAKTALEEIQKQLEDIKSSISKTI